MENLLCSLLISDNVFEVSWTAVHFSTWLQLCRQLKILWCSYYGALLNCFSWVFKINRNARIIIEWVYVTYSLFIRYIFLNYFRRWKINMFKTSRKPKPYMLAILMIWSEGSLMTRDLNDWILSEEGKASADTNSRV